MVSDVLLEDNFPKMRTNNIFRYVTVVLLTIAVVYVKLKFNTLLGQNFPLILVFFLVVLNALYGGFGVSIFSIVITALVVDYFFLPPSMNSALLSPSRLVLISFYILPAFIIVILISRLNRVREIEGNQNKWFEGILSSIGDAVIAVNNKGNISYINDAAQQLTGWKREEIKKKGINDIFKVKQEITGKRDKTLTQVKQRADFYDRNLLIDREGNEIPIEVSQTPLRDNKGDVLGSVIVFRNINEKKAYERRLEESEGRFKSLVSSSIIGIILINKEGKLIEANNAFLHLIGYSKEELELGKIYLQKITPPEYLEKDREAVCLLRKYGYAPPRQKEYIRKNGNRIPVLVGGTILDQISQVEVGFAVDMREQVAIKEELQKANTRVSIILASISDGFVVLDKSFLFTYVNAKAEMVIGKSKDEIIGESFAGIFPFLDNKVFKKKFTKVLNTHEMTTFEAYDGPQQKWYEYRVYPLEDGISIYFTDISIRKEFDRRKDEFIGVASHELRTPLTSIKGYSQLLDRMLKKTDIQKAQIYLKKTNVYIERLNSLISDLFDMSKIQTGKLQFNNGSFDFDELVKDGIDSIQPTNQNHAIKVEGKINERLVGDKDRLEQVFTNLLTNAIKYSPNANKVVVNLSKNDHEIKVSVTDFGIGIDPCHHRKIFERFYRVDEISKKFSGLGIGLYICREIIERHGGKIWVESQKGKGSVFSFTLPLNLKQIE